MAYTRDIRWCSIPLCPASLRTSSPRLGS
ncbi:hypothetical protein E2C01_042783 [Portunus trituberculatus]|uniref:Uncharacterized protein n=1 Tax=Portunus trituberculatus TaxID=210409 RepID=A0A5B7FTX8_PORTR|nr:hypothetical protein [Portunus trituberculatus]